MDCATLVDIINKGRPSEINNLLILGLGDAELQCVQNAISKKDLVILEFREDLSSTGIAVHKDGGVCSKRKMFVLSALMPKMKSLFTKLK